MKKMMLLVLIQLLLSLMAAGQVYHRVYLTANLADATEDTLFFPTLSSLLSSNNNSRSTLIINGDISQHYKWLDHQTHFQPLIDFGHQTPHTKIVIIPGDRDWNDCDKKGLKAVKKLEKLIKSQASDNMIWAIGKGCPGPKSIMLDDRILLLTVNTQWWNHPFDKPKPADADCKIITNGDFMEELEDAIDENEDKNVLIAGHYPLLSSGEYGGRFPVWSHLSPLPIIGSMKVAYRQHIGLHKDISNERYTVYRSQVSGIIGEKHNLIYLSGHDRNQFIARRGSNYLINSGAPVEAHFAAKSKRSILSLNQPGLIEMRYYKNGKVEAIFHTYSKGVFVESGKEHLLFQSPCEADSLIEAPVSNITTTCREAVADPPATAHGTFISLPAGPEYAAGKFKRFWLGDHYRNDWTTPVSIPYLNLSTKFGGLEPYKKGGGRQTTSLKLRNPEGKEYVFRSVNKDPSKAIDYRLRETIFSRVLRDQTTTQHPYGAMAVDVLLNRLDILHAHPELYILPNSPKLGKYRNEYHGLIGMLEDRPGKADNDGQYFGDADDILKSHQTFRKMYDDQDHQVDKEEFLRARVFDILIGDWGKHEDNWKWAQYKKDGKVTYRPIPRDRDHVFSQWDGALPWLADREWAKPSGENFDYDIKGLRSLMWQARHLDRFMAREANRHDWINAAFYIQEKITEADIDSAMAKMPQGLSSSAEIGNKLKSRLRKLNIYAQQYYDMLSKEVDVVGSNDREFFDLISEDNGSIRIEVFNKKKGDKVEKGKKLIYQRRFLPGETREIRLFGLGDKDCFHLKGSAISSIKVRIIGGSGKDVLVNDLVRQNPSKRLIIHEIDSMVSTSATKQKKARAKMAQKVSYDRTAFVYNTYFPSLLFSYNATNGLTLSGGVDFTRQRFAKPDYSTKHKINFSLSSAGNTGIEYGVKFRHVVGKWDLGLATGVGAPVFNQNFFGLGNETNKVDSLFRSNFYRSRYNSYYARTGLERTFWKKSRLTIGALYEHNRGNIEDNTILDHNPTFGVETLDLFGGSASLELDFRDHSRLPRRGTRLFTTYEGASGVNDNDTYGVLEGSFEYYATARLPAPLTLGVKVGGADSYGDLPFYKQPTLGFSNGLRGFQRNRFYGDSKVYLNTELRLRLLRMKTAIVPMEVGMKGFYDRGRVYLRGEQSDTWHESVGLGVYVVPLFERFTLSVDVSSSDEESVFFTFSLGTSL
ncbi:MAG: hypothetical protein AAFX87_12495 [Bacteroidota bacterium]